jgi:hypothetical protein
VAQDPIINNKLILKPENVIYIGLNQNLIPEDMKELLNQLNITYFTLEMIKNKGMSSVLEHVLKKFKGKQIYLHVDLKVFDKKLAPSTVTLNQSKDGLVATDLKTLFQKLKNCVTAMDITGFDSTIDTKSGIASKLTVELSKALITNIFDVKEKKMNIFNENSRFLIYRPRKQTSVEDIGWYIVRFMSNSDREAIMDKINDGAIIYINIDTDDDGEEEVMVTTTTMEEQNLKSYFTAKSIDECCLFPKEKMFMGFELIKQ